MIRKNNPTKSWRPIHTYSIVARDPNTGEMGVGVQSHYFLVGGIVSWGEAGVGVVATQSLVNKSFGLRGLKLLKQGKSPQAALDIMLSDDDRRDARQVALLDNQGRVAVHTGNKCIKYAGHRICTNFSVQANMMLTDQVWNAMSEAFQNHENLPLPERILKSLEAAESVGGDIRGKQSAALLVVKGEVLENKWDDPWLDLRVEDHETPLKELSRLMRVWRAYEHMDNGGTLREQGDMDTALKEYQAAQEMLPDNLEMKYWTAVSLANTNNMTEALALFKKVFKRDENWWILTRRLPEVEILNVKEEDLRRILEIK